MAETPSDPSNKNLQSSGKKKKGKISFSEKPKVVKSVEKYNLTPLFMYKFKDMLKSFFSTEHFPDALVSTFALISVAIALPFFPIPILMVLIVLTFAVALFQPAIGLMLLLFETFPMFLYQAPLLAWLFTIFMSVALFLGYKHYRTITFIYAMLVLPFSVLGYVLEIPTFVLTILTVGLRRGIVAAIITVLVVCAVSGFTGLPNHGSITYNPSKSFNVINATKYAQFLIPEGLSPLSLSNFLSGTSLAYNKFTSYAVISGITNRLYLVVLPPLISSGPLVLVQILIWMFTAFTISNHAIKSRSKYKGAEASLFSIFIPLGYLGTSYIIGTGYSILVLASFIIAPVAILFLEFNEVTVVRALDVMKQDFRSKFGEAFEDLTTGTKETLDDVADYEETKAELKEAILAPIEKRELAGAYNIKTAKGILLFGPPGSGKTYIMRALANELRAGFFYVKTSQILSPYPGASAQMIARIFATAKKHAPSILFFDEIDGIAGSRELQESETGRQILSTLLSEMDGFQKIESVVIVGATNSPQLLDTSIMRPGRFDKIIYIPPPDASGRKKIFQYYLKKLPISDELNVQKLAEITERYTGADIKNVCEEVAREVAEEASTKNKVLQINMADVVRVIKNTKPSTTLAQIDQYNTFKMDYERRSRKEDIKDEGEKIKIDEVMGLDDAKKALYEAVELPILHPELIKKYDVRNIKGILLFGPPGTGKTMLMRAVASELGDVHIIMISGAELVRYGFERAVEMIKTAFDRAKENPPAIIFVDEIDSVVPTRDTASELGVQLTGEFLEQLDGIKAQYNIVLVAATNRPDALDLALIRPGRFDKIIYAGPPTRDDRAKIFEFNLKKAPVASDIDYGKLADLTPGYTGADIANICRQAKLEALENNISDPSKDKINTDDIAKLIKQTKPSAPSFVVGRYLAFLARYGER